jgi:hypothetical protein
MTDAPGDPKTVIRIPPIAHFASVFLALSLLTIGPAFGTGAMLAMMVIPILLSVAIERVRTVADDETVTARGLRRTRTVRWTQIDGLEFTGSRWAKARLIDGSSMVLPAVTFSTLPRLTAASRGRVPNPYSRG